jgi:hypothetical protein
LDGEESGYLCVAEADDGGREDEEWDGGGLGGGDVAGLAGFADGVSISGLQCPR